MIRLKIQHKDKPQQFVLEWTNTNGEKCGARLPDIINATFRLNGEVYLDNKYKCEFDLNKPIIINIDSMDLYCCYDVQIDYGTDLKIYVKWKPSKVKKCEGVIN